MSCKERPEEAGRTPRHCVLSHGATPTWGIWVAEVRLHSVLPITGVFVTRKRSCAWTVAKAYCRFDASIQPRKVSYIGVHIGIEETRQREMQWTEMKGGSGYHNMLGYDCPLRFSDPVTALTARRVRPGVAARPHLPPRSFAWYTDALVPHRFIQQTSPSHFPPCCLPPRASGCAPSSTYSLQTALPPRTVTTRPVCHEIGITLKGLALGTL